jgi:hypothetical protein
VTVSGPAFIVDDTSSQLLTWRKRFPSLPGDG